KYWQSLFVAALFALHPLHVESVAWIAERKDLLSAFFMFAALIFYSRYAKDSRPLFYISALLLYVFGLMSKPMLVTLPFVMLIWDFWPLGRLRLRAPREQDTGNSVPDEASTSTLLHLILEKLPFFALSLLSSVVTYSAQARWGSVAGAHAVPFTFRLVNALVSYAKYIGNMLWPHHLAVIYPLPPTLSWVQAAVSGLILLGITLVVCRRARMNPFLLMGWLWYLGTLVPVIGFVQVGRQSLADRYTYIPLIGLFIMISWAIPALADRLPYRRFVVTTGALLALAGATIGTWTQVGYWKNDVTLFTHAIRAVKNNYVAHMNLGLAFFQRGKIEEAIEHYYDAFSLSPRNDDLCYYLGLAFGEQGNLDKSIAYFTEAVTINPKFAVAHYNLGVALARQGRLDEGIRYFMKALQIDPGMVEARKALETAMRLKSEKSSP
ncbi:MAG TPA: tetratricopeptide repeat protein, partial [Thermodesulfobacteriota bacterium]|nr:tetratricopeptide repeat protein [Thermodesulfobacteriota bacterium]